MARVLLDGLAPPRLPSPDLAYSPDFMEQYSNVLRLYFNRLNNVTSSITGDNGGQYVDCPNGLFFNTVSQTLPAINTGYPITYNNTYLHNAVDRNTTNTSRIEIGISGIYNFQYSGQLLSTNASAKTVWIWLSRDGTDIGYSTRAYTLETNNHYRSVSWNFNIDMTAGQYLEIYWAADDINVTLTAEAASTPHPGISSSVLAVNFIAPVPDPLPTPP
jgi:hypothetical protein